MVEKPLGCPDKKCIPITVANNPAYSEREIADIFKKICPDCVQRENIQTALNKTVL